jgi:hypothetical protein
MAIVTRDITRDFEPFGKSIALHTDAIVRNGGRAGGAPRVSRVEASPGRRLRSIKSRRCADGVAFGCTPARRAGWRSLRWMAGSSADILVKRGVRLVTIPFRHEMGAFQERRTCAWKPTGRS